MRGNYNERTYIYVIKKVVAVPDGEYESFTLGYVESKSLAHATVKEMNKTTGLFTHYIYVGLDKYPGGEF